MINSKTIKSLFSFVLLSTLAACTGQLDNSFRFLQQDQTFSATLEVKTKVDILWVIDNSASMDVSQQKLRNGMSAFADKYMKPSWDIRLGVITTDIYMADSRFDDFRAITINGSVGYVDPHVSNLISAGNFSNPAWNTTLVNMSTHAMDSGIKIGEMIPLWGPDYAKLLPGIHDGPITGFCFDGMPYFLNGITDCKRKDTRYAGNIGIGSCLNPDTGAGENEINQCINTVQNDTVRSGKGIINTKPPQGVPADEAWKTQLLEDFMINITTGSVGHGSERGMSSVLQLISDNEGTASALFRPNSIRAIIFVSDEEDQSMTIPSSPAPIFHPFKQYACDQAGLVALNPGNEAQITGSYCCTGGGCSYGDAGISCASKNVGGHIYTPSICADPSKLIPVSDVKDQLDSFFLSLDGGSSQNPAYFVASLVPLTATSIQDLQSDRDAMDAQVGVYNTISVDRGDRYIALGDLVGNGSVALDLGATDYSPILDQIGQAIVANAGTFELSTEPSNQNEMTVTIIHIDGSKVVLANEDYEFEGNILRITNLDIVLTLEPTDQININYQPSGAF